MVADPDHASILCGQTFARYAASGVEITLACASADGWDAQRKQGFRGLGVRHVVLLGFPRIGLTSATLEGVITDVMASVRPHVVVADGAHGAIREAATSAFNRVRQGKGSSAIPAKLYYRASGQPTPVHVTTRIRVPYAGSPELFVRVYPSPWVTGVLEDDLFAGIGEAPVEAIEQQLAS